MQGIKIRKIPHGIIKGIRNFLTRMTDYEAERLIDLYAPFSGKEPNGKAGFKTSNIRKPERKTNERRKDV
jgi:hypothetical protein